MTFADEAWWQMVTATIHALHGELDAAPTMHTVGGMGYRARELGWDVDQLRAWLATQTPGSPPAPVPVPPVPVPPVPPEPPASADAIDLSLAVITAQSPDVRAWPIGTRITEFTISHDGTIAINFDKRNGPNAWPFVMGAEGEIQYTLWVGCQIPFGGLWYFSGVLLCISRGPNDNYVPTGPTLAPGQLPNNWYYFAGNPLATYQPAPGERVCWFVTSGVQRRADIHQVFDKDGHVISDIAERSNIIAAPFQAGKFV